MKREMPFWFWNGDITHEEIRRQIHEMAKGGVGGFFLHPRQGMDLPYLSDTFFEHVKTAVKAASDEGLSVYLYDEYPYPSGVAGGELLLNPDYRARNLYRFELNIRKAEPISYDLPWGKILLAKAYPVIDGVINWYKGQDLSSHIGIVYGSEIFQEGTGLTEYNRKRFFTGNHKKRLLWNPDAGEWAVRIFVEKEADHFKYFGGFADPLNPEAMRAYMQTVHARYEEAVGSEFGKTIKGIFTDEVAPFSGGDCIWSPLLPGLYEKETGEDLIERLPFLFEEGPDYAKIRYQFHDIITRAFIRSFDEPVSRWCAEHHLRYAGEKPHLRIEQIASMHFPGCDTGHQKAGDTPDLFGNSYRSNPKAVASSSHFFRDGSALCEAYHSVGWGMTLRDMRWMADWIGIQGVTDFVPHAFYYSTSALRKYDAPPSEFSCMPWWKYNSLYANHLERISDLQSGRRIAPILILDPTPSVWTAGEGRINTPERDRRYQSITSIQKALCSRHLDYYIIDRNAFPDICVHEGKICLHGEQFDALVLPECKAVEKCTLQLMTKLITGGAQIYTWGELPSEDIGFGNPLILLDTLLNNGLHLEKNADTVAAILQEMYGTVKMRILSEGNAIILSAQFEKNGMHQLILENTSRYFVTGALEWTVDAKVFSWKDLDSGELSAARVMNREGKQIFFASFEPFETKILTTAEGSAKEPAELGVTLSLYKPLPMHAENPNLLRMGHWDLEMNGQYVGCVSPAPIVNQLESLGLPIPSRVTSAFGCDKEYAFAESNCCWTAKFYMDYSGPVFLLCENRAVSNGLTVKINGTDISSYFVPKAFWNESDLQADLTDILRQGVNQITVSGPVKRDQDGLVNALYLVGDFGCWKTDGIWTIRRPALKGAVMNRIDCGLPFYCGTVSYEAGETPREHSEYCITNWAFEECAELFADGISLGTRAWNPYRWQIYGKGKKITLKVTTSLLAAFEGLHFDLHDHQWIDPEA